MIQSSTCSSGSLASGSCAGFTCISCADASQVAFSDGSACVPCGNSTEGLNSDGTECSCPVDDGGFTEVLLETDQVGEYLSEKSCEACADGTRVFGEAFMEAGVYYSTDPTSCRSCPDEHMSFDSSGQCSCDDGYTSVGSSSLGPLRCVDSSYVSSISSWTGSGASTITYRSVITSAGLKATPSLETLLSLTFQHLLTWAGASCYSYTGTGGDGLQACQTLGNLCILQLHSPSSSACSLFSEVLNNRLGNSHGQAREKNKRMRTIDTGWGVTLPWLSYVEEARDVRDGTDIEMELTFASEMNIFLAKYSLDGVWLGLERMTTQPYYCGVGAPDTSAGGGESRSTGYLKFGHSMTDSFECDLSSLLAHEVYFYDPYVMDEATGELHPIAVLNVNYDMSGSTPNLNESPVDEFDDLFTRRFVFFDVVSGVTDASGTTASISSSGTGSGALVPEVVRYMSSMRLTFKIRDDSPERIYPPVLEVTYAEVKPALWTTTPLLQQPTITFTVEYTMDSGDFWDLCRALFAVVIVLTSLTGLWRLRNWHVRTSHFQAPATIAPPRYMYQMVNWHFILQGILLVSHTFVLYLFPFVFLLCSYWFVFFKLQQSVFLMLPADRTGYGTKGEYFPLEAMVDAMFLFQLCRVGKLLHRQCTSDVFLVDWEKDERGNKGQQAPRGEALGREGVSVCRGVSVWRQLLVANEWNRLGTRRRVNPLVSLMWMAFILGAGRLQYNATPQPDLENIEEGELNPALRFANVTFWWSFVCGVQWFVTWGFSERYILEQPALRFVDLATMAKVSVLILDEKYHGWYIHCRSPYAKASEGLHKSNPWNHILAPFTLKRAGVPMETMSEQLDKEEAGLTTDRGLEGCAPGLQAFELFITSTFRKKYDRVYRSLLPPSGFDVQARLAAASRNSAQASFFVDQNRALGSRSRGGAMGGAALGALQGLRALGKGSLPKKTEKTVAAARELNGFLKGFVEQSYTREELTRSYREPAWWDRIVGTPPDMRQMTKYPCILYPDHKNWFTSATFLGIEVDLLLLNITTFHLADQLFGDPVTSALITFVLDRLVLGIRVFFGRANISRKTLVDDRFLL
ncbi:unnamed protein product [Ascophyllum nodosum]